MPAGFGKATEVGLAFTARQLSDLFLQQIFKDRTIISY
jgi:hypothetical protein